MLAIDVMEGVLLAFISYDYLFFIPPPPSMSNIEGILFLFSMHDCEPATNFKLFLTRNI